MTDIQATPTHTLGPWKHDPKYGDNHTEGDGFVVLRSVPREDGGRTITMVADEVFTEGDARLIAAAPDLLAAAKRALPYLASHVGLTLDEGPGDRLAHDALMDAIAKAEGR